MNNRLLYNAKVYVERGNFQEAVLISGETIRAVGSTEDLMSMAGEETEKTDCRGKTIIPGLNDSHMHFMQFGETMNQAVIENATSISEMIEICRKFAEQHPEKVREGLHACGWNQDNFTGEKRLPDRHDLDRISTEYPILLERVCGHIVSTNTCLLEMLQPEKNPEFKDEDYGVDEEGRPNGIFYGNGTNLTKTVIPDFTMEERRQIILETMDHCIRHGLTSIQSNDVGTTFMDGPAAFQLFRDIYESGEGKIRYRHQVCFNDLEAFREYLEQGEFCHKDELYTPGSRLTLGPLKLFKDGSLGARTALMKNGFTDNPENQGLEWISSKDMDEYCRIAREHGLQVVTHCIGDEAIRQTMDSYEKAFIDGKNVLRHGLVHCQITDEALLDRIVEKDHLVFAQPVFLNSDIRMMEDLIPEELAATSNAWETLFQKGAHVSYGTDCPVESCNPFQNIYCAVTRKSLNGKPSGGYYPQECVDVETAVDAYTIESAYAEFQEDVKGRIREGYYADLVLLDRDIFTVPKDEIKDICPVMTMIGGEILFWDDSKLLTQ